MKMKCHTTPFDLLLPHRPCFVLSRPLLGEQAVPACNMSSAFGHTRACAVMRCDAMRCDAPPSFRSHRREHTHTHAAAIRRLAIPTFDAMRCDLLCFAFPAPLFFPRQSLGYGGFDHKRWASRAIMADASAGGLVG